MGVKRRAAIYAVRADRRQLREEHPEIPRFLPAYGPLAQIIAAVRRHRANR